MQKSRPWGGGFVSFGCLARRYRHYIFTVRGSASLKLRVDSAGRTISLLPVYAAPAVPAPAPTAVPIRAPLPPPASPPMSARIWKAGSCQRIYQNRGRKSFGVQSSICCLKST